MLAGLLIGQQGLAQSPPETYAGKKWEASDFSTVDLTDFEIALRDRRPLQDASQFSSLARRNLQYIFFNRLNRNHFLAPPSAQDIAARVLSLFRLNEEITLSIADGKNLATQNGGPPSGRERVLIRQIEESTKRLRQQFEDFFLEPRDSTYSFRIPVAKGRSGFIHFLRQADRINQRLTEEMNDYFLAESPGSIHLNDYQKVTITVLTESLTQLCKLSRKGVP